MLKKMVSQLRTGANLMVSQIQEIGNPYKVQKREIYRRRNPWKNDLSVTSVSLKSSIWLLKLIFTQLSAINDSEYQILFHINNANISLKSDIGIITKSVLMPKSDLHHAPTCLCREINLLCYQNHNCSNCKLKTIKSPLTCWRGYK